MQRMTLVAVAIVALGVSLAAFGVAWGARSTSPATQGVPAKHVPYQGFLTDANGVPVEDGERIIIFRVYDSPDGRSRSK